MVMVVIMVIVVINKKIYLRSSVIRVIGYTQPSEANCLWWFVGYLNFPEENTHAGLGY